MAVSALTSSLRVFRFDPVKSMQENLRTDTHPQSQKKAGLGKAAHEEFGRGGHTTKQSPQSCSLHSAVTIATSVQSPPHPPVIRTMTPPLGRVWGALRHRKKPIGALEGAAKESLELAFACGQVWQRQGQSC